MRLVDIAREGRKTPAIQPFTREHYELAAAFARGEFSAVDWRRAVAQQSCDLPTTPEVAAWRILSDGVRRGLIVVDVRPAPTEALPRLCDGAVVDDDEAA